jgi:hypothetical protein
MIYYRRAKGGWHPSRSGARALTSATLLLYPAGALLADVGGSHGARAAGLLLVVVALGCFAAMAGTSLQRIVGEEPRLLDEYELKLRSRAVSGAYKSFTALVLLAIIYCAIGVDHGAWLPHTYGEYSGIFWGAFLYASVLPSAFLAWQIDEDEARPEGEVHT